MEVHRENWTYQWDHVECFESAIMLGGGAG